MYPLSKQAEFVTNVDKLRETSSEVATGFRTFRQIIEKHGPLDDKQRELCLVTGFTATRNEGGFRVHVNRARAAGATVVELEQVVLFTLGTTLGLAPVVEALGWLHDELGFAED
jgi:alkylhydroperoxidase/carboxymuconolactone decarboxylase family protein YurZ